LSLPKANKKSPRLSRPATLEGNLSASAFKSMLEGNSLEILPSDLIHQRECLPIF